MFSQKVLDAVIVTVLLAIALAFYGCMSTRAGAQGNHHHPHADAELHDKFYSTWMRPDTPHISCCNKADCYPTEGRYENGTWFGKRREDGKWLPIPVEKIETKRDMPDTRVHMCAPPPGKPFYPEDHVFCFGFSSGI